MEEMASPWQASSNGGSDLPCDVCVIFFFQPECHPFQLVLF